MRTFFLFKLSIFSLRADVNTRIIYVCKLQYFMFWVILAVVYFKSNSPLLLANNYDFVNTIPITFDASQWEDTSLGSGTWNLALIRRRVYFLHLRLQAGCKSFDRSISINDDFTFSENFLNLCLSMTWCLNMTFLENSISLGYFYLFFLIKNKKWQKYGVP